jgi:hypothetical protein
MPNPITPVLQAVAQRVAPKTILGFLLGVLTITAGTALGVVIAVADNDSLRWLAVGAVAFLGLLIAGLVIGVFRAAAKDPTPLVLRDLSGPDYLAIQRLILGDSASGERQAVAGEIVEGTATEAPSTTPDVSEETGDGNA